MTYAPVNGLQLYYEIRGSGRPLVPLHGGLLTIDLNFGPLLEPLAASRQVIAVELQGHGHTADTGRAGTTHVGVTRRSGQVLALITPFLNACEGRSRAHTARTKDYPHRDRRRDLDQRAELEEPGVIDPGGKRGRAPARQACFQAVLWMALAALAVAGPERDPVARLACADRELLQACWHRSG